MASNKYVPPALRSKAIPTASDFPALGTARPQNNTWKTSFAVLASDWNEHAEEETAKREFKAAVEKREADKRVAEQRAFVNRKRPVDAIYDMDCEEDRVEDSIWAAAGPNKEENGWTTVEPKLKKELTLEERIARDQKVEEEEKRAQAAREAARDSVWGDASEWDYRDRRAVA
jgi:hypothetical protein